MKKILKTILWIFCITLLTSTTLAAKEGEVLATRDDVLLQKEYASPQVIYRLPKDSKVTIIKVNKSWCEVSCQLDDKTTITGWVPSRVVNVWDGPGLSPDQQEYVREYTYKFVEQAKAKNIYIYYNQDATALIKGYNLQLSNGVKNGQRFSNKIVMVCSTFAAAMLHHSIGAPLHGETVDGVTYVETHMRGTGFANPRGKGKDVFFDVGNDYLQPGDVLTYLNYGVHAGLYLGYNSATGYHELAETGTPYLKITALAGTKGLGSNVTIQQVAANTKWRCASRLKYEVLPKDWVRPDNVVINWPI